MKAHALVASIRRMCSDEIPHETIDAKLAELLYLVKDLEGEAEKAQFRKGMVRHLGELVNQRDETVQRLQTQAKWAQELEEQHIQTLRRASACLANVVEEIDAVVSN